MSDSSSRRWTFHKPVETSHQPHQSPPPTSPPGSDPCTLQGSRTEAASGSTQPASAVSDAAIGGPVAKTPRARKTHTITPLHYQSGYGYPLLVWLHSAGCDERQVEQVLPHISVRNYIGLGVRGIRAIDLRGRGFDWAEGRSAVAKAADVVLEAIDTTMKSYCVHPNRIILAGYGSGATLACRIAMRHWNRFAGVVRMSGRFPCGEGSMKDFKGLRERGLPMLWQQAINGIDDDADRLREEITAAQWIRAKVEIRQYVDDDVMNTVALRDIDRWCFDKIMAPQPTESSSDFTLCKGDQLSVIDFSAN